MTATATGTPAPVLDERIRRRLVDNLIGAVVHDYDSTADDAVLVLDTFRLTGNFDLVCHAIAARHMRDGLIAGDIAPGDVDPSFTVPREQARDALIAEYDADYQDTINQLAEPAPVKVADLGAMFRAAARAVDEARGTGQPARQGLRARLSAWWKPDTGAITGLPGMVAAIAAVTIGAWLPLLNLIVKAASS